MNAPDETWNAIWRSLAISLLRDRYCSIKAVERWAKDHKWRLRLISDVIEALAIESFLVKWIRPKGRRIVSTS